MEGVHLHLAEKRCLMALMRLTWLVCASFLLFWATVAQADGKTSVDMELRSGLISHRNHRVDLDVERLHILTDVALGKRVRLHLTPTFGVARMNATLRGTLRRKVSSSGLKKHIVEATEESPRKFSIPINGIGAPPGLLPTAIEIPIDDPGDLGKDIGDSINLNVPFYARMTVPWTPTVGFRTSLEIFPRSKYRLEPYVEYEHSLGQTETLIDTILVDAGGIGLDVGFMRGNLEMTNNWSLLTAGGRFGYAFKHCRPYLDLGMLAVRDTYDIHARGALRSKLVAAKVSPKEGREIFMITPFYTLGIEIDLNTRVTLRAEGAIVANKNSATSYLNGGLIFHLTKK